MANHLPIDGERAVRAAEQMIAQHGDSALAQAEKQIKNSESEGFDHVEETWKLIHEVIIDTQQSDRVAEGNWMALSKGVLLSERVLSGVAIGRPGFNSF